MIRSASVLLSPVDGPGHGRPEVVELGGDRSGPQELVRSSEPRRCLFDEVGVEGSVSVPQSVVAPCVDEMLAAVLAHRLEQSVAGLAGRSGHVHHGLVDEAAEELQDIQLVGAGAGGDVRRGGEVEAPGEHRQGVEQALLVGGEELVRPVDRRPQRGLPRRQVGEATGRGEEAEPVAEAGEEIGRAQQPDPGGGQLDRQRQPVQMPAYLGNDRAVLFGQREAMTGRRGALDEQLDRVVLRLQRFDRPDPLTVDAEGLTTRRQDVHRLGRMQQLGADRGDVGEKVLTVVDHQQHLAPRERVQ